MLPKNRLYGDSLLQLYELRMLNDVRTYFVQKESGTTSMGGAAVEHPDGER